MSRNGRRQHPVQPGYNWGCIGFVAVCVIVWTIVVLLLVHYL